MGTLALPFTSVGVIPSSDPRWTELRIAHFEELKAQNEAEAEKYEEQVRNVQKKMQAMESQFDVCTEDLFNQTIKLEEMEKKAGNAEGEVSALRSRLILLQENNEKQEERLCKATLELAGACKRADAAEKKIADIEEELRVVGQNLQTLEVGEEKTIQREEKYQAEIMELRIKLKAS